MEINNLDAIEFTISTKKHIRVYYQTKDKMIRETSYETDNGWFVRNTNIIAQNAMTNSPITVTRWLVDNAVQIRVYYLNDERKICECEGEHNSSGVTVWRSAGPLQLNKTTNVAIGSSLAVARPDRDDATLRVFYQEGKTAAHGSKNPIREIKYRKVQNKWMYQNTTISDALENTRFSAVSAGKTGAVRVYYQGTDNRLRITLWDTDAGNWRPSKPVYEDDKLAPGAPISALAWYASDTYSAEDLRVRIYTTLASSPKKVVEIARNGEDWEEPVETADTQVLTPDNSSIGVCRERTSGDSAPTFVFYKPKSSFIDLAYPHVEPALTAAVQDSYRPHGIPVSL